MIKATIEENLSMKVLRSKQAKGKREIHKLKNQRGEIVHNKEEIVKVVQTFYEDLYKSIASIPVEAEAEHHRRILNVGSEEIPCVTKEELRQALKKMKNGKAPGTDNITSEMVKMGGDPLEMAIIILINKCLDQGKVPASWNDAEIKILFKKGDCTDIGNYRPISLLSVLYKLLTSILTTRLNNKFELYQPKEQAGFRKGYSTTDHLQVIHSLIEKSAEYNIPIHLAMIDYKKAFDSLETWAIVRAMNRARVDSRYTDLIKSIYENATLHVKIAEDMETEPINVHRGIRQGDSISPKLFTLALEDMFKDLNWEDKGILIDGEHINHLRYADDLVLITTCAPELQIMLDEVNEASRKIGLEMNLQKTKVLSSETINIVVNGERIEQVQEYVYLGHKIKLGRENLEAEVSRRISLSWAAFGKLKDTLCSKKIPINLKRKVYDSCILPVSTYGLETKALNKNMAQRLWVMQRAMERRMLGISIRDRIRNDEIRRRTKVKDVVEKYASLKWRWAGHVARRQDGRWTKRIILWRPRLNSRQRGRPPTRWTDDIISTAGHNWVVKAQDRKSWRDMEEAYVQEWMRRG
jgi:hypothetical protein